MELAHVVGELSSPAVGKDGDSISLSRRLLICEVVVTEHHVLVDTEDRTPVGRLKQVIDGTHQLACFGLCFGAERQVNSHLVAIVVGIKAVSDERVELDRLALNQLWLEGLDAQAV